MNFAAAVLIMSAAALEEVAVRIAPDQPATFTYADEPLVVEFASPQPMTFHAAVTFTGQTSPAVTTVDLGSVTIDETGRVWQTIPNAPQARGWFAVDFALGVGTGERRIQTAFCRIDRPGEAPWQRLRYAADPAAPAAVSAGIAANLGGAELELPAAAYPFAEVRRYKLAAALRMVSSSPSIIESAPSAPRWWLAPAPAFAEARRVAQRQTPTARVAAIGDAAAATTLFEAAPEVAPESWLVSDLAEVAAIRRAAERAGHEGLGLQVVLAAKTTEAVEDDAATNVAQHFLAPFLDAWALFPNRIVVGHDALFTDAIRPAFARVAALARVLPDARYVGPIPAGEAAVRGALFLLSGEAQVADWVVVAEATGEETVAFSWPDEWADKIALRDGYNNPLPSSANDTGARTIGIGANGVFVFGVGGGLPLLAAHVSAARAAQDILSDEVVVSALPAPTQEAVTMIAGAGADDSVRDAFFVLVRSLPQLERAGREGAVPVSNAIPAAAALARLARLQAVWAEERGDEFLEPLSETLARTAEFKSRYLTGGGPNGATAHDDWLAGEVSRLVSVARDLADRNRPIEADAVAALAEWRARSLIAGAQ